MITAVISRLKLGIGGIYWLVHSTALMLPKNASFPWFLSFTLLAYHNVGFHLFNLINRRFICEESRQVANQIDPRTQTRLIIATSSDKAQAGI